MKWNNPTESHMLPAPGSPLRLKLSDGRIVEGCRPGYIENATDRDPIYHDRCGNRVPIGSIEGWAHQAYEQPGDHLPGQPQIDPINQYRK